MARKSRKNIDNISEQITAKTVYNVGAYIRLSVFDKKQKGDSIETQKAIISAFIVEHPDMELRETYIDNGLSGQSFERPAFQQMIADMECEKINCCVVKDLSRLGRNAIDSGYYIEKYFPSKNVRFVAVNDNYDSNNAQNGNIMISLKNMVNEAYALDISRKVRATTQMNIKNGCFVGGMAPYGYLKNPDDCHKLIVDKFAANVVRQIFEMAANGNSIREILAWLNDNEYLTPSRYLHSIGQATANQKSPHIHWSNRAVRSILSNRIYCGDMVQGKQITVNNISKKLPESEWVITENTHESIISREIFAAVQELWKKPIETKQKTPYFKKPQTENPFLSKVFCGDCGFSIVRKRVSENAYCFKCNTKQLYYEHACGGVKISEIVFKGKVFDLIRKHGLFQSTTAITTSQNTSCKDELDAIKSLLNQNQMFLKGLYESLALGDITECEYKEMKNGYKAKIASLTNQANQLRENEHRRIQEDSALLKAQKSIQKMGNLSEMTTEIIDRIIEKITVFKDTRIAVKFRFSDEEVFSDE